VQNSPLIPLAAVVVAVGLAILTFVSLMIGVGGGPALNELQIGATAWALALTIYGVQGMVSVVVEGRQVSLGWIQPRLSTPLSAAIAGLSVLLLICLSLGATASRARSPGYSAWFCSA